MKLLKIILLANTALIVPLSLSVHASETCGEFRVHSGATCKELKVEFDLGPCGEASTWLPAKISCKASGTANARVTTANGTYRLKLKQDKTSWDDSTWRADGKLAFYPIERPKSREVAQTDPTPKAAENPSPSGSRSRSASASESASGTGSASASPATPASPVPSPSPSSSPFPLTMTGNARFRAEGDDHTDLTTDRDFSLMRVRIGLNWHADPQVDVFFQPQFTKTLGENTWVGNSGTTNASTQTSGSNANYDPTFGVHQAFINYHPVSELSLLAGRQVLSYGDELVIGAADWNNVGRSFDAIRARGNLPFGTSDLFASKIVDTNTTSNGPGDANFFGWYNSFSFAPALNAVDAYALYLSDSTTAGIPTQNTSALGVRVKSTLASLDYRIEATKEYGNATNYGDNAHQVDAEAGYTLPIAWFPRFGVEGFYAGANYNQLYPTAHKWLGYADVFGRKNIEGFVLHSSAKPASFLVAQLDFQRFYRPDPSVIPVNIKGTPLFKTNVSSSQDLGSEWDLTLRAQATKSLTIQGGASTVNEGQYLIDEAGSMSIRFYYIQLEVAF